MEKCMEPELTANLDKMINKANGKMESIHNGLSEIIYI